MAFSPATFAFLRALAEHNDRAWFQENKARFEADVRAPMLAFIGDVSGGLRAISKQLVADPSPVGGSMFRIHRDTRFSKDKAPYKTHVAAQFRHVASTKDVHAPGYYFHVEPGSVFVAAGFWHPEPTALGRIRDHIVAKPKAWQAVRAAGLTLGGESLKRPPAGYASDHPAIEDLKRKDFIASVALSEAIACSPELRATFLEACRTLRPLMKFLTAALDVPW